MSSVGVASNTAGILACGWGSPEPYGTEVPGRKYQRPRNGALPHHRRSGPGGPRSLWHHPADGSDPRPDRARAVERAASGAPGRRHDPGRRGRPRAGGQPVWSGGFGLADPFTGVPMTADRLFRVASITKTVRGHGRAPAARRGPPRAPRPARDPRAGGRAASVIRSGSGARVTIGQVLLHVAGLQTDVPADPGRRPGLTPGRAARAPATRRASCGRRTPAGTTPTWATSCWASSSRA